MVENSPRNTGPNSGSLEEQVEALQDDVNLLKIEIKQTLVDLREFMLKRESGFLPAVDQPGASPSRASSEEPAIDESVQLGPGIEVPYTADESPPHQSGGQPGSQTAFSESWPEQRLPERDPSHTRLAPLTEYRVSNPPGGGYLASQPASPYRAPSDVPLELHEVTSDEGEEIDVEMLVDLLHWLDSIKGKGLSSDEVAPFLQAYEAKGSISPLMARLISRSVVEISRDDSRGTPNAISSEEYMECLRRLHAIICGSGR